MRKQRTVPSWTPHACVLVIWFFGAVVVVLA